MRFSEECERRGIRLVGEEGEDADFVLDDDDDDDVVVESTSEEEAFDSRRGRRRWLVKGTMLVV